MEAAATSRRRMHRGSGRLPILGTEIAPVDGKLADKRRGRAQADVKFLERVVVDKVELDILVAAALAGFGGCFPQQVDARALCIVALGRLGGIAFWLCISLGKLRIGRGLLPGNDRREAGGRYENER